MSASPGQQAQQQIMSGSSRRTATDFTTWSGRGALQWRLLLVKGEAHRDNRVVAALDAGDEALLQGNATFAREVRGVTGAGVTSVASGAPNPLSRSRRAPSTREGDARCTRHAARRSSCNRASSGRARRSPRRRRAGSLGDHRYGGKVERGDCLADGQPRITHIAGDAPSAALGDLVFGQGSQELSPQDRHRTQTSARTTGRKSNNKIQF